MIQQFIKKYKEPEPYSVPATTTSLVPNKNTSYSDYKNQVKYNNKYNMSQELINKAIDSAKERGIAVGQKWRYKNSPSVVHIIGFETNPEKVYTTDYGPMIIRGQRLGDDGSVSAIFTYGINELIGNNMELVTND